MKRTAPSRGFTFLEMLAVLAIINVLSVSGTVQYKSILNTTQAQQCLYNRSSVNRSNQLYAVDQGGAGSVSVENLVSAKYLEAVPLCAVKGTYVWVNGGSSGAYQYLVCSIHGGAGPVSASGVSLFSSDFIDQSGLKILAGKWSNVNGSLVPGSSSNRIAFGDPAWNNYSVSVSANLSKGAGYGIGYLTNDAVLMSGYLFKYESGGKGKFSVIRMVNGVEMAVLKSAAMPKKYPILGQSHTVTISISGSQHTVSVDGSAVLQFTDQSYSSGTVQLSNWSGSKVYFENASVVKN